MCVCELTHLQRCVKWLKFFLQYNHVCWVTVRGECVIVLLEFFQRFNGTYLTMYHCSGIHNATCGNHFQIRGSPFREMF